MELLYTGATKQNAEQLNPDISLGGLVSGSVIPNDTLSNIFSTASNLSVQNKRREIKMIALKNNNGDIVTNLSFTFAVENDSICKYKIAFVSPTIVSDHVCFEKLPNPNALPYHATFESIINDSVFDIELLENDSYLGIWLMREYDYTSNDLKKKTRADWITLLDNPIEVNQTEYLAFTLNYTIGEPSISNSNSVSI